MKIKITDSDLLKIANGIKTETINNVIEHLKECESIKDDDGSVSVNIEYLTELLKKEPISLNVFRC